jgi:hypothetical protein
LNISLVIYCQNPQTLHKIHEISGSYAPFFSQCLIVLNIPFDTPLPALYPPELHRVSVLQMPDQIDAGAALGKMLSHLHCNTVLLLDSRAQIKKELLTILRQWGEYDLDRSTCVVSFQTQVRYEKWHNSLRQGEKWLSDFRFVSTLSWGAILFDCQHILSLGGFDPQLSDEALMIDLSWKVQGTTGMLLETIQPLVILKEEFKPSIQEIRYLSSKYPLFHPSWSSFMHRGWSWFVGPSPIKETQTLN